MNKIEIKCVVCASKTEEAKDLVITSTVQSREIVITGLTGTRCPQCGEQYVDAESSRKALMIANI
jgi:YgiT-type zinc finger domain-containing protein